MEGVLVSCDDDGLPARRPVLHGDGADQVVSLPAIQLVHGDVHGPQHLLEQGKLAGQLVGHPLAGGFVSLVGQVAEGGGGPVKGDAESVGLAVVQQLVQNVQKAKDGVGRLTFPCGQVLADSVEGPVDDGIAVNDHQFFHSGSSLSLRQKAGHKITFYSITVFPKKGKEKTWVPKWDPGFFGLWGPVGIGAHSLARSTSPASWQRMTDTSARVMSLPPWKRPSSSPVSTPARYHR